MKQQVLFGDEVEDEVADEDQAWAGYSCSICDKPFADEWEWSERHDDPCVKVADPSGCDTYCHPECCPDCNPHIKAEYEARGDCKGCRGCDDDFNPLEDYEDKQDEMRKLQIADRLMQLLKNGDITMTKVTDAGLQIFITADDTMALECTLTCDFERFLDHSIGGTFRTLLSGQEVTYYRRRSSTAVSTDAPEEADSEAVET